MKVYPVQDENGVRDPEKMKDIINEVELLRFLKKEPNIIRFEHQSISKDYKFCFIFTEKCQTTLHELLKRRKRLHQTEI